MNMLLAVRFINGTNSRKSRIGMMKPSTWQAESNRSMGAELSKEDSAESYYADLLQACVDKNPWQKVSKFITK